MSFTRWILFPFISVEKTEVGGREKNKYICNITMNLRNGTLFKITLFTVSNSGTDQDIKGNFHVSSFFISSTYLTILNGTVFITSSTFFTLLSSSDFKAFFFSTTLPIPHSWIPTIHKALLTLAPNNPPASLHTLIVKFPLFSTFFPLYCFLCFSLPFFFQNHSTPTQFGTQHLIYENWRLLILLTQWFYSWFLLSLLICINDILYWFVHRKHQKGLIATIFLALNLPEATCLC